MTVWEQLSQSSPVAEKSRGGRGSIFFRLRTLVDQGLTASSFLLPMSQQVKRPRDDENDDALGGALKRARIDLSQCRFFLTVRGGHIDMTIFDPNSTPRGVELLAMIAAEIEREEGSQLEDLLDEIGQHLDRLAAPTVQRRIKKTTKTKRCFIPAAWSTADLGRWEFGLSSTAGDLTTDAYGFGGGTRLPGIVHFY